MHKMSAFNLEYHYGLLLNLVSDAALGLFLVAGKLNLQNTCVKTHGNILS